MAAIEQIVKEATPFPMPDALQAAKDDSAILATLFKPLIDAGFDDFTWIGKGTNAFFVAPNDNDQIVFRISTENKKRRKDVPFFLASPYEISAGDVKLEMLLTGKQGAFPEKISETNRNLLLEEMKLAGWRSDKITHLMGRRDPGPFWGDVVMISIRDRNGRIKAVPIVSDPSAITHYLLNALPPANKLNICGEGYITMQDQAAAYNAAREADPRLKKMIPQPVEFPMTEMIAPPQQSQSQGHSV